MNIFVRAALYTGSLFRRREGGGGRVIIFRNRKTAANSPLSRPVFLYSLRVVASFTLLSSRSKRKGKNGEWGKFEKAVRCPEFRLRNSIWRWDLFIHRGKRCETARVCANGGGGGTPRGRKFERLFRGNRFHPSRFPRFLPRNVVARLFSNCIAIVPT